MTRELDDAILSLRTNELELGLWLFKATGDPEAVVAMDRFILDHQDHWFVREVLGMMRRTFARLDVSSRSMFTFITPGSCFAGTLLELALASDRVYMLQTDEGEPAPSLMLSPMNFGALPMVNDLSRLAARFYDDRATMDALRTQIGVALQPADAVRLGLVTDAPDALDWDDEMRQAIESRVALSPDALTGMVRAARESGDTRVRPALGLAELGFRPAERHRPEWRPEGLWQWGATEIRLGTGMSHRKYEVRSANFEVSLEVRPTFHLRLSSTFELQT
jgi:benzoyl-CoA-dihydrodiol lyase